MPERFDPYHIWLSIPPEEQPPNHYRLLGIPPFEANPDAIESAADRQMAHLRTFQSGPHGQITQRLLNEVSAAKLWLLDPRKKAVYDEQLRGKLAAQTPATVAPYQGQALHTAVLLSDPADDSVPADLIGAPEPKPRTSLAGAGKAVVRRRPKLLWFMLAPLASVLLVIGVCIWISGQSEEEPKPKPPPPVVPKESVLAFDWPSADRSGVTLSIDDARVAIPAAGPWEYRCPAGRHRIVAQRTAFKPLDKTVTATAGGRQTIPVAWQPQAMLALEWPPDERAGVQVKIDGQLQADIQREPWELPVEPGKHTVSVTWPDAPAFESEVLVLADSLQLVAIPTHQDGKLWVVWPYTERKGGKLTIDGQDQDVPDRGYMKFTLKPGQHKVYATRPGHFAPYIDEEVTVVPGQETQVKTTGSSDTPPVATHKPASNPNPKPADAAQAAGSVQLEAADAKIIGSTAKLRGKGSTVVTWTNEHDLVRWQVNIPASGEFEVLFKYACSDDSAGNKFKLSVGERSISGAVQTTGDSNHYTTVKIGVIRVDQPGRVTVTLKPTHIEPHQMLMNLKSVTLTPLP